MSTHTGSKQWAHHEKKSARAGERERGEQGFVPDNASRIVAAERSDESDVGRARHGSVFQKSEKCRARTQETGTKAKLTPLGSHNLCMQTHTAAVAGQAKGEEA